MFFVLIFQMNSSLNEKDTSARNPTLFLRIKLYTKTEELLATTGAREAHLHLSYRPSVIRGIPSQTNGNIIMLSPLVVLR